MRRRSRTVIKAPQVQLDEIPVEAHVKGILATYGNAGVLTFSEFQEFLMQTPGLFNIFVQAFNESLWSSELLESTTTSFPRKSLRTSQMSGELWVKSNNQLEKKYGLLRDELLLLYENYSGKYPYEAIFLKGCYTEIIGDFYATNKFGISISCESSNQDDFMFWSDSRKERDEWIKNLEYAAKQRRFKEFYSVGDKIGQGKFSEVYVCTEYLTYKKWAVKVINKSKLSQLEKELLQSEISILRIVNHPGVIKTKEVFDSKKHIMIIMELVEGGELFERILVKKVFSEFATSKIIKQILEATLYLHKLGIMHRDIKPENILLADRFDIPSVKIADFGLSKLAGPNDLQILACGTLGYVAPEVLSQSGYNNKVDLWSIGIIAYLLLRGRLPFDHKEKQVLIDLTLRGNVSFEEPYWRAFTPFAIDFLKCLIERNPESRMSCEEALSHQWIKNADILIPRAIDKKKMEELFIDRGVSSTNFGQVQYREISIPVDPTFTFTFQVHSMPHLYEDPPSQNILENPIVSSISMG